MEILSDKALIDLCRHARLERKTQRRRFLNMTGNDVLKLLEIDISQFRAELALGAANSNSVTALSAGKDLEGELALPPLSDDEVGPYEDKEEVALLVFARNIGQPVLVELDCIPSESSVERLRQSAKIRKWTFHLCRLIDRYVAVQVRTKPNTSESDVDFLKIFGINGT